MSRLLKLLVSLAAVAAAPTFASAQAWPATTTSSTPAAPPRSGPFASDQARLQVMHTPGAKQIVIKRSAERTLRGAAPTEASKTADAEKLELRPKQAWVDDQGVSLEAGRVAFRRRF